MVDAETQTINILPPYYFFGQISKFVCVNSTRVSTTEYLNSQVTLAYGDKPGNGDNVEVFRCGNLSMQMWTYDDSTMQLSLAGTSLCMGDESGGKAGGANVRVYTCNGSTNLKWKRVANRLVNQESGYCASVQQWHNNNGANVFLLPCDEKDASQVWQFESSVGRTHVVNEIKGSEGSTLCLQAGRLSVSSVGFVTPFGDSVLVVQNTANNPFNFKLTDPVRFPDRAANLTIPMRSIATFIF